MSSLDDFTQRTFSFFRNSFSALAIAGTMALTSCIGSKTCNTDFDCSGESLCIDNLCSESCDSDYDCPGEEICMQGRCLLGEILPRTTKILNPNSGLENVVASGDRKNLQFNSSSSYAKNLEPGDIIVAGVTEHTPHGFLGEVVSSQQNGPDIVVTTASATLEDALENGELHQTIAFTPNYMANSQPLREGVSTQPLTSNTFVINFDDTDLYNKKIFLDGSLTLAVAPELDISIRNFKVQELEYKVVIDEDLALRLYGKYQQSIHRQLPSIEPVQFAPIVFAIPTVPPLPVVVTPNLTVEFGLDASGELSAEASLTQKIDAEYGLLYKDGSWSPIANFRNDFAAAPPRLTATQASAEAYAKPKFSLDLYDVAGPYAAAKGSLGVNVNALSKPWYTVYTTVDVSAGVHVEAIGKTLANYEKTGLFVFRKDLLTAPNQCGNNICDGGETNQSCPQDCDPVATCTDACDYSGQRACSGDRWKQCGDYDSDDCLEWSSLTSCASDEHCSNGRCVDDTPSCSNDCSPSGSKVCSGSGWKRCGDYDADSCLEWSSITSCNSDEHCSGGRCVNDQTCSSVTTIFRDDFNGASLDTNCLWSINSGSPTVSNGALNIGGTISDVYSRPNLSAICGANNTFTARVRIKPNTENNYYDFSTPGDAWYARISYMRGSEGSIMSLGCGTGNDREYRSGNATIQGVDPFQWHTVKIENSNGNGRFYLNNTLLADQIGNCSCSVVGIYGRNIEVDYVKLERN